MINCHIFYSLKGLGFLLIKISYTCVDIRAWISQSNRLNRSTREIWDISIHQYPNLNGVFYPRPVLAFGYCRCLRLCVCVCVSVCLSVCQSLACPCDNSGPVQARIAKFGPKMQKTLVKVPIVLGGNWPWPSRSNLTSKSEFTPFWACPDNYSPPILVRISKFGQQMHFSTIKIPLNSGLDWPWTSPSFLIQKLFFSLWQCALRLWNSPWFVSMLFRDCFTVSTPVHMGNAQPKWNGASCAVVLNLN